MGQVWAVPEPIPSTFSFSAPASQGARNLVGAAWMLASAMAFATMSILVKILGDGHGASVGTLIFWRSLTALLAALPFALRTGLNSLKISRPLTMMTRAGWSTAGFFLSFYALIHLPLADNQALSFSRTLFVTILAVFMLKEKVAWRRWSAVAIGFVGILIMARPQHLLAIGTGGTDITFFLGVMAALVAAFSFAIAIVTIKDLTIDHTPMAIIFWGNLVTAICGLPFLLVADGWPNGAELLLMMGMGLASVSAQSCYVRALSLGDASLMGLLDYVRMPLAIGAGIVFFATRPDTATIVGALIVIASTLYITLREAQLSSVTESPKHD